MKDGDLKGDTGEAEQNVESEAEHKVDFDAEGNLVLKKKVNVKRGGKSKAQGTQFELRVRHDLEDLGWTVDKWTNNLDLEIPGGKIIPAKKKMGFINSNLRFMTLGTGFPDFVCFQLMDAAGVYKVIGVEVKMNGKLSRIEKDKCNWYLKNKTFSKILIASKVKEKNRVKVVYHEFEAF